MGHEVCTIFFDLCKAFDSVPHQALMTKLCDLELDGYLLQLLHNFLLNRKQTVVIDGEVSDELSVLSGVPLSCPSDGSYAPA